MTAEVNKRLDEVTKRQDEHNKQYLSNLCNTRPTDSVVSVSLSDATVAKVCDWMI